MVRLPSLGRRTSLALAALALSTALAGCLRFHLFQVDLPSEMHDQNTKNLAQLPTDRPPISAENPLRFAFVSDSHDGYENWHNIVAELNQRTDIELVVHSGDFTDFGGQQEFIWFHEDAEHLTVPILVGTGNHDGLTNGTILFRNMFGADNFDFSYRGVHFLFFNTNTLEWDRDAPDLDWLAQRKVLGTGGSSGGGSAGGAGSPGAAGTGSSGGAGAGTNVPRDPHPPTVIVTHHPPRSKPHLTSAVTLRYWKLLEVLPVDLYLYGHIHDEFKATLVNGVQFVKARTALQGAYSILTTTDGYTFSIENCLFGEGCTPGAFEDNVPIPGVFPEDDTTLSPDEYE